MLAKKSSQVAIIVLDTGGSCILLKGKYTRQKSQRNGGMFCLFYSFCACIAK